MNFIEVKINFASNSQEDAAVVTAAYGVFESNDAIPAQFLAHDQTFVRGGEFVGVIPQSLVLRSIVLGWILIHRNWSIALLLLIQNISPFLKEFRHFALCFSAHQNNTTFSPGFLSQRFNNLQRAALLTSFWRDRFNNLQRAAPLTSLVQYLVNSSWLWWIVRSVLTNQKRKNSLNE